MEEVQASQERRFRPGRLIEGVLGTIGVAGTMYVAYHQMKYGVVGALGPDFYNNSDFTLITYFGSSIPGAFALEGFAKMYSPKIEDHRPDQTETEPLQT